MLITKGPYLQNPCNNAITIRWETDVASTSEVRMYNTFLPHVPRLEIAKLRAQTITGAPRIFTGCEGTLHSVIVDGLAAGCDYCYEVCSKCGEDEVVSELHSLRAAPDKDTAFSFVLLAENGGVGDPDNKYTAPILNLVKREHPDFIMSVGDIVHNGTLESDWDTYFFSPFANLIADVPFYPCVGNHEVNGMAIPDADVVARYKNYEKYFAFPRNYSFDYGCAHFCVIDCPSMFEEMATTDTERFVPCLKKDIESCEQYAFLKKDLEGSQAKWKFVVFHYPPYTSAVFDVRELQPLASLFEKCGVDIVFNSHAIIYERSHPIKEERVSKDGVRYILVGGFGCFEHWLRDKRSRFAAKLSSRPNYVHVSLTPFSLELQAIDHEGKLFDTLTLEK